MISLLRLWTHNPPFLTFRTTFRHTMLRRLFATPCQLNAPLHDMIQASGTARTLFQHPEKLWHVPRPAMCSVTLPKDSPRNLDQPRCHALPYIVSRGSTLEWRVPCAPSCLKFYLSYKLSLRLTHVLQFYSATFVYCFVSYLRLIGCAPILACAILL